MLSRAVYSVILLLHVVKGEEPQCSKFDFEEKVLEKMVRMEFEMEKIKLEMQKNAETVQNMTTQVQRNVDLFSKKQEIIDNQMEHLELLKDKLSDEVKRNLDSFKEVHRKPTVAFKARSNSNINVQDGMTLVFPVIIMNVGSGYDSTSGVFTAPVNGTYLFTTALCVIYQKDLTFVIMVNGKQQSVTTFYGDGSYSCHSADSNAVLTAGQKVWVQVLPGSSSGDTIAHYDGYRWNTFSGTLVNS